MSQPEISEVNYCNNKFPNQTLTSIQDHYHREINQNSGNETDLLQRSWSIMLTSSF